MFKYLFSIVRIVFAIFIGLSVYGCNSDSDVELKSNENVKELSEIKIEFAEKISFGSSESTLHAGRSIKLIITGAYSDNSTINLSDVAEVKSEKEGLLSISGNKVTGLSAGETKLYVEYLGVVSNYLPITISDAVLEKIVLTPPTIELPVGATRNLAAMGEYSDGKTTNLTNEVTWISENNDIASVNDAGILTAKSNGKITVTAKLVDVESTNSISVSVNDAVVTKVQVTPSEKTLAKGLKFKLLATAFYDNNHTENVTDKANWVSSGSEYVSVDSLGEVTAKNVGDASVSATFSSIKSENSSVITVTNAELTQIQLDENAKSIAKGEAYEIIATGHYTDGTTNRITNQAAWVSDSRDVAIVSATGSVTAVGVGSANIKVTLGKKEAIVAITVTKEKLTSIKVDPAAVTLAKGLTKQLSAEGVFTDGSKKDLTALVAWTSTTNNATVTNRGLVTASLVGSAVVKATYESEVGSSNFTVTDAELTGLVVDTPTKTLAKGVKLKLKVMGNYTDGSTQDVTSQVAWVSSDSNIATVVAGEITAVKIGDATITGTLEGEEVTTKITVVKEELIEISVTPSEVEVTVTMKEQLSAEGIYTDGSREDLSDTVSWSANKPDSFSISSSGLIVGIAPGEGVVTVTSAEGDVSTKVNVTVVEARIVKIDVTPDVVTAVTTFGHELSAEATYDNGSKKDVTNSVHWATKNESVAVVSNQGVVAGISIGKTIITAAQAGVTSNDVNVNIEAQSQIAVCGHVANNVLSGLTGGGLNDKSQSNGTTECIKLRQITVDSETLLFSGSPSIAALERLGYVVQNDPATNSGKSYAGSAWTYYGTFINFGAGGGQVDRFCNNLNVIKFAEKTGWRSPSSDEMVNLYQYENEDNISIETAYGWVSGSPHYWTSTKTPDGNTANYINMHTGSVAPWNPQGPGFLACVTAN